MNLKLPKPVFLTILVLLNALPVYGVFEWGWKSFDLIFLYWLENIIIGVFMILRMVVRPYSHVVEFTLPVFMVPFFTLHYGMFCYGHGTFIVSLFGKGLQPELAGMGIPEIIYPLIKTHHLFWPLFGLFAYQMLDWLRDTSERGLGSEGVMQLTTAPYRRIMVLHITILASGFALGSLNEPTVGLLLLVAFKTGFDIYHWQKDEQVANRQDAPLINEKIRKKVDSFLEDPKITINGKQTRYESFEELKASPHYALLKGVLSMTAGNQQLKAIEAYIEERQKARGAENNS